MLAAWCCHRSSVRRSFLVGRPRNRGGGISRNSATTFSRAAMLSADSTNMVRATIAEPRFSETALTTRRYSTGGFRSNKWSPGLMVLAGLTRSPCTSTRPAFTASTASCRVLKKRAAHSHLSSRVPDWFSSLVLTGRQRALPFNFTDAMFIGRPVPVSYSAPASTPILAISSALLRPL